MGRADPQTEVKAGSDKNGLLSLLSRGKHMFVTVGDHDLHFLENNWRHFVSTSFSGLMGQTQKGVLLVFLNKARSSCLELWWGENQETEKASMAICRAGKTI